MSALTKDDGDVPAPWVVESDDMRVVVRDANGGFVAESTDGFEGDDGWVMAAKSEDVARLIAAAPDLLEALIDARRLILELAEAHAMVPDGDDATALPARIDAAIAKATGEPA